MTKTSDRPAVDSLSFEQAQEELEQIVELLEDRHTGLDDALDLWERGEKLHRWCQKRLDYAAERLQKLTLSQEEIDAVNAESGDEFAPDGVISADAIDDPAPASSVDDVQSDTMF